MLPQIGKLDKAAFDKLIFSRLGKADNTVLVPPQHGVDAAVIELSDDKVMVIAEDPTLLEAWEGLGWAYWSTGQKQKSKQLWERALFFEQ